ncbi:hypothetical protein CC2G_004078 [Coprinopsis cinerea AmutBmut pab1-1]|nr:hypothetical protein CC2G_004078 [Coprinopsis cinerea AmutBmut pab1-1]
MGDSDNDGGPVELPVARKTMPRRRRTKPYQRKSIGPLPNKIHQNPPLDDSDDNTGPLRRPALKSIPRRPLSGANSKGVDTAVPAAMTGFNSELPTGRKTGPVRAARKTSVSLTPDPSSSEESASEDDASQHTDTSIGLPSSDSELESSSESESDEEDNEAASGFKREPTVKQEDGDTAMDGPWHGPAELIILDTPPKITIPLPQIDTALEEETRHKSSQCPKLVWRALEHLLLPTNRMQETRQLPFLLRNLRKGFLGRCSELGIPVGSRKGKHKSLTVYLKYEVEGGGSGSVYETSMEGWRCPLCSLHGTFALKRPLDFHLRSDHEEISVKWDLQHDDTWLLRLMLPNPPLEEAAGPLLDEATSQATNEEGPLQSPVADVQEPGGPHPGDESLFPSVTMSPPTSPSPSLSRTTFSPSLSSNRSHTRVSFTPASSSTLRSTPFKMEDEEDEDVKPFRTPSTTTGLSDRSTTFRSSTATTTGRSTTAATTLASSSSYRSSVLSTATATSTTRTATTGTPSSRRYPTPPPPDDPLGPVSRRPKFPLVSEYDGPTIYYSCRINPSNHSRRENDDEPTDNEPTVFDWLGTLPLDDYGLMDWAILDKEEEIWESDDVTDEQKVMHALWARWIFLNRWVSCNKHFSFFFFFFFFFAHTQGYIQTKIHRKLLQRNPGIHRLLLADDPPCGWVGCVAVLVAPAHGE